MKILITGSSGFIGSELVRRGKSLGHKVYGFDVVEPSGQGDLSVFRRGSILDLAALRGYVEEVAPEAIIHLAAACDITDMRTDAAGLSSYPENMEGVRNIIEAVKNSKTVRRVIYTSTQLVAEVGSQPKTLEECRPTTFYGKSKLEGEKLVHSMAGDQASWVIVRPTSVWGPGMGAYYRKFIDYLVAGKYFHISNKPLFKSYSYIENIAYQYYQLLAAPSEQVHGETFYLADYEPLSLRRYADLLQQQLGSKPLSTFPEGVCRGVARVGDLVQKTVYRKFPFTSFRVNNILSEYVYDMSKTEAVCGPLPVSFEEGVEKTARWYAATGETEFKQALISEKR